MEFVEASLETLNYDTILKILEHMNPQDVLSLCQTSKAFAEYCRSDEVFRALMKKHYPKYPVVNDAKEQYVGITNQIMNLYLINHFDWNRRVVRDSQGNDIFLLAEFGDKAKKVRYEIEEANDDYRYFITLPEYPLKHGRKYWFSVRDMGALPYKQVFPTKEDAVDDFLEIFNVPNYLLQMYNNIVGDFVELDDPNFVEFLEDNLLPVDLTKEGLKEYIMENGFLNLDPMEDDPDNYMILQIFEVTIE